MNKTTQEAQAFARGIVTSAAYRKTLKERAENGKLAPAVEAMLWHYYAGKPPEKIELAGDDGGPIQVIFGGRFKPEGAGA